MKWLWIVDGNLWLCEILTLKNITKTGKSHVGVGVVLNSLDWENPWKSKPNCNLPTALHRQLACITTCQQLISTALAAPLVKALVEKLKTEIEIKAALEVAEALPFRLRVFPQGSPNKALQNRLVLCVFFYGSFITDHMCHVCLLVYCPIFNVIWFFSHKSTTSHSTILSITSSSLALSFLLGGKDRIMHYVHGHVAPNEWTPLTPVQVEHEFSLLKFRVLLRVGNPEGICVWKINTCPCPHSLTSFVALDSFDKMSKTPGEKRQLKALQARSKEENIQVWGGITDFLIHCIEIGCTNLNSTKLTLTAAIQMYRPLLDTEIGRRADVEIYRLLFWCVLKPQVVSMGLMKQMFLFPNDFVVPLKSYIWTYDIVWLPPCFQDLPSFFGWKMVHLDEHIFFRNMAQLPCSTSQCPALFSQGAVRNVTDHRRGHESLYSGRSRSAKPEATWLRSKATSKTPSKYRSRCFFCWRDTSPWMIYCKTEVVSSVKCYQMFSIFRTTCLVLCWEWHMLHVTIAIWKVENCGWMDRWHVVQLQSGDMLVYMYIVYIQTLYVTAI